MSDMIRAVLSRNGVLMLLSGPVGPEQIEAMMLNESVSREAAIDRLESEAGGGE